VIVATHDWETVRKMQRRIITMERGSVLDDGSQLSQRSQTASLKKDAGVAWTKPLEREP
jgi:energy-coupling factor transporter ATP-binding protein EcfA2